MSLLFVAKGTDGNLLFKAIRLVFEENGYRLYVKLQGFLIALLIKSIPDSADY
jgi:hypothetical protein